MCHFLSEISLDHQSLLLASFGALCEPYILSLPTTASLTPLVPCNIWALGTPACSRFCHHSCFSWSWPPCIKRQKFASICPARSPEKVSQAWARILELDIYSSMCSSNSEEISYRLQDLGGRSRTCGIWGPLKGIIISLSKCSGVSNHWLSRDEFHTITQEVLSEEFQAWRPLAQVLRYA